MKHALVIPLAVQGHVATTYRFALQLARRGVTITFVTMAKDVPKMQAFEELQGLDFRVISYPPSLTTPSSAARLSAIEDLITASGVHFKPILEEFKARKKSGLPGPTCVVYDWFCTWARDVAEELNIPLYTFFSTGAIYVRCLQEFPRLLSKEGPLKIKEDGALQKFEGSLSVPGLPPLTFADLPMASFTARPQLDLVFAKAMEKADVIIVNTFYELEYPQIDEIERRLVDQAFTSGGKKTELFLVGPLSNTATFKDISFARIGLKSGKLEHDTKGVESLQWLYSQPPHSVLYICLGSLYDWKPLQMQILTHSAVGGFLTHCGWNSLIESVSAGVPLICWPQAAEQHLNRKYIVDVLKIGVDLGPRVSGSTFVRHEEFEKAVRFLMVEDDGKAMRSKVRELMLTASAAVTAGGASSRALDEISKRIPGNCTNILA
ncbi:hypothetical protein R1sor_011495 [Riccia sorocarpa]|uniref:Glycosyltransferase n=1 Tax=Riccia sorocarpa TaxID=122646 RepID=A0ABD3I2W3_9MARC